MIVKVPGGWRVKAHSGRNLSGVLKSYAEAKKRLQEVEYFKKRGGSNDNRRDKGNRKKTRKGDV